MAKGRDLETRKAHYYRLNSRLAQIDNKQMATLLEDSGPVQGWGATKTIKVDSLPVFVKRIPLTQREYDNLFSTANLFEMPPYYNYGVGSAGFGAFRELVAHVKTTNWVLDGSCPNFPLMYHYRIVPSEKRPELDEERHQGYIKYWNSDPNIDAYIRARNAAPYEILLFLEHFPHVLYFWLNKNLDKSETVIREMRKTLYFLRDHGILHFDAHFGNIVLDGEIPYLTDFGLVLDKSFALTKEEKAFFNRHTDYDEAEFLVCLGSYLAPLFRQASASTHQKAAKRYGIRMEMDFPELLPLLLNHLESLHANRLLKLSDIFVAELVQHREAILLMNDFFFKMRHNEKKDTPFPHARFRQLLHGEAP